MSTETSKLGFPSTYQELAKALGLTEAEGTIFMRVCQAAIVAAKDSDSFDDDRRSRILRLLDSLHVEICAGPVLRAIETLHAAIPQQSQPQEQDAK